MGTSVGGTDSTLRLSVDGRGLRLPLYGSVLEVTEQEQLLDAAATAFSLFKGGAVPLKMALL
jgi:hypothetical protein